MIVPSRSIGPFRLGMTEAEVRAQRRLAPCEVRARFADGRAARLETNCGGAYRTAEHVQVGGGPERMLRVYGTPQARLPSDIADVRGEWLVYERAGIAFRVVYGRVLGDGLIQAIAVFPGSGVLPARRPPPATPPPGPPPTIGQ